MAQETHRRLPALVGAVDGGRAEHDVRMKRVAHRVGVSGLDGGAEGKCVRGHEARRVSLLFEPPKAGRPSPGHVILSQPDHVPPPELEIGVGRRVVLAIPARAVERKAVDLHSQPMLRPVGVDLVLALFSIDERVVPGLRQPGLRNEGGEEVFQAALGVGRLPLVDRLPQFLAPRLPRALLRTPPALRGPDAGALLLGRALFSGGAPERRRRGRGGPRQRGAGAPLRTSRPRLEHAGSGARPSAARRVLPTVTSMTRRARPDLPQGARRAVAQRRAGPHAFTAAR